MPLGPRTFSTRLWKARAGANPRSARGRRPHLSSSRLRVLTLGMDPALISHGHSRIRTGPPYPTGRASSAVATRASARSSTVAVSERFRGSVGALAAL